MSSQKDPKEIFSLIQRPRVLWMMAFFLPLVIWIILFRSFLFGDVLVNLDTQSYYTQIKYYMNNLLGGVFPLWDPFVFLGRPFYSTVLNGAFNPLLYLMVAMIKAGMNYYQAFMVYLFSFLLMGALGFYFLSKAVLKSRVLAFVSFIMFLFSGMSAGIFTQSAILLIFVPCVWFFFFLFRFFSEFKRSHFLGLTFAGMLVLTSYIPFHFATVFFIFCLCYAVLYFRNLPRLALKLWGFIKKNWLTVVFCLLALVVAAVPLMSFKISDISGAMVSPARHCSFKSPEGCYQDVMKNDAAMEYAETARTGGLGERISFSELFFDLNKKSYHTDDFFYMPLMVFIIVVISCWTPLDKKKIFIFIIGSVIFLISLGEATQASRFFYDHVFYFKYFRNLFYFSIFIIPLFILFAVMQLKSLLEDKKLPPRASRGLIVWTVASHLVFFLYFWSHGERMATSYVTITLSLLFFVFLFAGSFRNYRIIGFLFIAILQPAQVFHAYAQNASGYDCKIPKTHHDVSFSYMRPLKAVESQCPIYRFRPYIVYWYDMALQDAPPIIKGAERISRGVYFLAHRVGEGVLLNYARNKFYLYDNVDGFRGGSGY